MALSAKNWLSQPKRFPAPDLRDRGSIYIYDDYYIPRL